MRWIKRLIIGFLSIIGLITVISVIFLYHMIHKFVGPDEVKEDIKEHSYLVVKLGEKILSEGVPSKGVERFLAGRQKTLPDVIRLIHHAQGDSRIKGIILKLEGSSFQMTHIQELREAIKSFKQTQKPVYAYSDSLGEGGNGTGAYYLSSCANEIWLQPRGSLNLTGLIVESYFLKGVFEDYKIKTQMDKREAYKGVLETYTEKEFSPQTRENLQNILDDLMDQLITDVAQDRQMNKKNVKDQIDHGPYNDQEALNLKLVDHLGHYDELKDHLEKKSGTSVAFIPDRQYMGEVKDSTGKIKIALIFVEGGLMGNIGPVTESEINSPRQIAKNLDKALQDKDIHAVVLRINSPGGTITAAETLWHEVNKFRQAKKPLVVSMGGTAASAAYQLAVPATKIIANAGTLTGSIGVASGKIILNGLLDHFNVGTSSIKSGANAGMWSMLEEFSPESWEKVQHSLDYIYDDFLTKVAQGRNMDKTQVRQIAQGKIWTGRQALEHHLVDGLGGLTKAIEVTKEELGLSQDASVELISLTPKPAFLESLFDLMSLQVAKLFFNQMSEYALSEPVTLKAPAMQVKG